jgi:transposase-like protein
MDADKASAVRSDALFRRLVRSDRSWSARSVREFIQAMVEGELDAALMRPRYGRRSQSSSGDADGLVGVIGHRHGHRSRSVMGTFGRTEIEVPRARLDGPDGKTTQSKAGLERFVP